jgi:tRNA (adenine37-N6)-methyltransferase
MAGAYRKKNGAVGVLIMVLASSGGAGPGETEPGEAGEEDIREAVYEVRPIGRIHNREGEPVQLEIFEPYREGLHRLDLCSHVQVLWWFHENDTPDKRSILKVHPRGNEENPLTGVFATHSPMRPNLIAVTVCEVMSVADGIVTVDAFDAYDGTPKSTSSRKGRGESR